LSTKPYSDIPFLQNCEPELPADGVHVGFLVDQLANLVPVPTLLALVADRSHAFAPSLNCTQSAAIFCGNRRDKLFGEILRTHGLKDRETKRTTKPYCLMRAVGSVKQLRFCDRSAPRCVGCKWVIRIAGIHKIPTRGAQQSFDLLDRLPNHAARLARLNLAF